MGSIFSLMEIRSFKGNNINRNQMNPYRFEHKSSDMDFLLERVAMNHFGVMKAKCVYKKFT